MTFESLPVEIIAYILLIVTPAAIRRCQQVSRLLRNIILENPHIQYILELNSCGYVEPANPRQDLNYLDKVRLMRETKARWLRPNLVKPSVIELPVTNTRSPTYEYADGVYVRGSCAFGSTSMLTRCLNFYQLPSLNKGTAYKHWCHEDLGLDTRDFGICPRQDLLVLLEIASITVPPGSMHFEEHYKIHLRTMSTNKPHPAARWCLGAMFDYRLWTRSYPDRSFYFQILGHLLAVVFRSRDRELLSCIVVWDWTTGLEIVRLESPGGPSSSFSFISEDYFIIPRNSESYDLGSSTKNDTMGRLDLCSLRPNKKGILSYEDCLLASFMLPRLERGQGESCLHLRCAPTPTPISCYVQQDPYSRLYDIAPESQLLCINIRTSSIINFPFNEPHGTLYVPSHSLLNVMAKRSIHPGTVSHSIRIPWGEWAIHTSWVDTREFRMNNERYMFGQRTAAFSAEMGFPGDGYNAITILDFDECRLRMRQAAGLSTIGAVCSPQPTEVDSDLEEAEDLPVVHDRKCGQRFFEGGDVPQRSFVKTIIGLPSSHMDMFNSIMMDDEHIVVKTSGERGRVVLVYSF